MKTYETKERTETYEALIGTTCDLCGRDKREWRKPEGHHVDDAFVFRRHGFTPPECDYTKTESFDVCPECWESKIAPLFPGPPQVTLGEDAQNAADAEAWLLAHPDDQE